MRTHNLRDLTQIVAPVNTHYIGTWKPNNPHIVVLSNELDGDMAADLIKKRYRAAIKYNRKNIDEQFTALYGKPLYFSDKITSKLVIRIKEVMAITGKSLKEIAADFELYMGKKCSFFRKENGKQIPIDSQRIMDAYKLIQDKHPIITIENILYN